MSGQQTEAHELSIMYNPPVVKKFLTSQETTDRYRIPSFEEASISTMTHVIPTNLIINLDNFVRYMPVTDYVMHPKKRGRQPVPIENNPNCYVPSGSIIQLHKGSIVRGIPRKHKKSKKKSMVNREDEHWKHSVTVVMLIEPGKTLNVKVPSSGKLHITGAKKVEHCIEFVKYLLALMIEAEEWSGRVIFSYADNIATYDNEKKVIIPKQKNEKVGLEAIFFNAMKNLDFSAKYAFDNNKLSKFVNLHTDFRSIYESSMVKIVCVNIKLPARQKWDNEIPRLRITADGEIINDKVPIQTYVDTLSPIQQKDFFSEKWHTFLCFRSGKVIFSSAGKEMPQVFQKFVSMITKNRQDIEDCDYFDEKIITNDLE